jgi:hypothetical protein
MGCEPCQNNTDSETPESCCPSKFCDDRLSGLPIKRRVQLLGVEGRCLVRTNPSIVGIFQQDGKGGGIITNQPRLPMPISRSLLLDSAGKPIPTSDGDFQEDVPPPMDFLIGAQCDGLQFRVKGTKGQRQDVVWDGCKYVHEPAALEASLDDFQYIGPQFGYCDVYELVLVRQENGSVVRGYRSKPSVPPGVMMMWGGLKASLPKGWIACEGQELEAAKYPDLFAAWGYAHGGSAGLFRVPDTRGRFIRGVDGGAGLDPDAGSRTALHAGGNTGDAVGSHQSDSLSGSGGPVFEDDAGNNTEIADESRPVNVGMYFIAFAGCIIED